MPAFSPGLPMPRRTWYLQVSCIALTLSVMPASLPSLAQAQGKERAMEHPTFYRTIQIDVRMLQAATTEAVEQPNAESFALALQDAEIPRFGLAELW